MQQHDKGRHRKSGRDGILMCGCADFLILIFIGTGRTFFLMGLNNWILKKIMVKEKSIV